MSDRVDQRPADNELAADEQRFAEQLRRDWQPPEMSAADWVRFDARLEQRLARGKGRWLMGVAWAGALAAATAVILMVASGPGPVADQEVSWLATLQEAESTLWSNDVTGETDSAEDEWAWLSGSAVEPELDELLPADLRILATLVAVPEAETQKTQQTEPQP